MKVIKNPITKLRSFHKIFYIQLITVTSDYLYSNVITLNLLINTKRSRRR